MAIAAFNIPVPAKSEEGKIPWETLELPSLPPVLAKQVVAIHEAQETIKTMKASFAEAFNNAYAEEIPDDMIRIFGFNFKGVSIANVVPKARKGTKGKIKFVAKKTK